MSHVLAVGGHRRGGSIGSRRTVLVTGATGKGSEGETSKAGEEQGREAKGSFGHIDKGDHTPETNFSNGV